MNILITGSDGFIGKHLCRFLKKKKINFFPIKSKSYNNVFFLKKKNIDIFTHIIHLEHSYLNQNYNIRLSKKLLKFALKNNIKKFIFTSTCVYKYKDNKKIGNSLIGINLYVKTKIILENLFIKHYKKKRIEDLIILRIFNVYGKFQNKKYYVIPSLISRFKSNDKSVNIRYPFNKRDFIYVDDVIMAIYKSLSLNKFNFFDIGSGKSLSIYSLAKKIRLSLNSNKKIHLIKPYKSHLNYYSKASLINRKKNKLINWKPKVKIDSGLNKIINY
jgi:UDP-glucose 4-epimerase